METATKAGPRAAGSDTREDLAEKASEFLLGVLERMGVTADIDIKDDEDKTTLEIQIFQGEADRAVVAGLELTPSPQVTDGDAAEVVERAFDARPP